jgi:S1-C subfamily serine protease
MFVKQLTNRWAVFGLFAAGVLGAAAAQAQVPDGVLKAEAERIAVIEKVKPSVVAVFDAGGKGGGSGVLIDEEGYALTNFHVVAGSGPVMKCGLADGVLYDGVLVGLDKVGDVAVIKLLPKKEGQKFPVAALGDSDKCREGDWSLAMGNPFLLATDFNPTVTYGLISGVHRYQYPEGTLLDYTDCIQIDTSINPGNSGGPLFNMKGELIGINGRGSFDKRPRINSGVGYAISINQIKNFYGHMLSGLDTDHASTGAAVTSQTDSSGLARMQVTSISPSFDIYRRGLRYGDEIVSMDGRFISSTNQLKNVIGLFPRGWRVPMEYRRQGDEDGVRKEIAVRLMGFQRKLIGGGPDPQPKPKDGGKTPPVNQNSPAAKFYQPKAGYANYYFNKKAQDALLAALKKTSDFAKGAGNWELEGEIKLLKTNTASPYKLEMGEEKAKVGDTTDAAVRLKIGENQLPYECFPLKGGQKDEDYVVPAESGGLLAGFYAYRKLLTEGPKFFREFSHGGLEPYYPPSAAKKSFLERKRMGEVITTEWGASYRTKFYFDIDAKDRGKLMYIELRTSDEDDPCEIYFDNYKQLKDGRWMPQRIVAIHGDSLYCTFDVTGFKFEEAK